MPAFSRAHTVIGALVLAIVASAYAFARQTPATAVYQKSAAAVIRVSVEGLEKNTGESFTDTGSGFFISEDGLAVTADHLFPPPAVIDNYPGLLVEVTRENSLVSRYKLICRNHERDFAIIKPLKLPLPFAPLPLPLAKSLKGISKGDRLYALGHPIGGPNSGIAEIEINTIYPPDLWVSGGVTPGYSGGPVVDDGTAATAFVSGALRPAGASAATSATGVIVVRSTEVIQELKGCPDTPLITKNIVALTAERFLSLLDKIVGAKALSIPPAALLSSHDVNIKVAPGSRVGEQYIKPFASYRFTAIRGVEPIEISPRLPIPAPEIIENGFLIRTRLTLPGNEPAGPSGATLHLVVHAEQRAQQR